MRIKRKKKNNNHIIIVLIVLLFGISIGYASFADTLNIVGTANANGKFAIEFTSGKITDSKGINILESSAKISDTKDTLVINIKDMQYPGSGATVSCVVKNTGTVPAKLTGVKFTGNNDSDISITYSDNFQVGQTLNVNESKTLKFVVKWNIDSTLEETKAINFKAELNYEQDVEEYQEDI